MEVARSLLLRLQTEIPGLNRLSGKFYALEERSLADMRLRESVKWLFREIIHNSEKCIYVEETEWQTVDVDEVVPEKDRYLLQTLLAAYADTLVTTDRELIDTAESISCVKVQSLEDFIKDYDV